MQEPYKEIFQVQIVTFYVLINSAFVGKNSFVLIKMHGKTTIKTVYSYSCTRVFEPRLEDSSSVYFHNTSQYIQASAYIFNPPRSKEHDQPSLNANIHKFCVIIDTTRHTTYRLLSRFSGRKTVLGVSPRCTNKYLYMSNAPITK